MSNERTIGQIIGRLDSLHEGIKEVKENQKELFQKMDLQSDNIAGIKSKCKLCNGNSSLSKRDFSIIGIFCGVITGLIEIIKVILIR